MSRVSLALRAVVIAWHLLVAPLRYVARLFVAEVPPSADERERWQGEALARALERLGATFVKFGQILGSRPDLLPPGYVAAFARLQDDVEPAPFEVVLGVIDAELAPDARARIVEIDPEPLAAASVAQVHAARLASGERVVLKVQRPDARAQIERDLALMSLGARALDAIPSVHLLSLPGAVERFGEALRGQLDFSIEAANNARFAKNFARERGIKLPRVHGELTTARVLTMERVDGVKATEHQRVGHNRRVLAERGGRAILKMVFEDGFVHADLHPGNILLSEDGTMTFLDLGMVAEIPLDLMKPWTDTFAALARRDGRESARLFYVHAPSVGSGSYEEYERDVVVYLERLYGARLGEVEVSAVVSGMMNVLRRHRVKIEPVFTVVNVALLVAEGLGKQLDPDIDLVSLAVPYLVGAQLAMPPGRAPRREIPIAAAA